MEPLVFIGLGNPGKKYAFTRHNMGFLIIEEFAKVQGISLKEDQRFNAKIGKVQIDGREVHLLLPMTYMNESGEAISKYLAYYKLMPSQTVIVHDDIAFELGAMRLNLTGSAGGHNGLRSIITHLHTQEFHRLRVGIGKQRENMILADYVLSEFTAAEVPALSEIITQSIEVLKKLIVESQLRK